MDDSSSQRNRVRLIESGRPPSGPAAAIPPLKQIAAALRRVTEILARETAAPTPEPPSWSDPDWRIARAVASMQGISSLLAGGVLWKTPACWREFLQEQREHTAGRQARMAELLGELGARSRRGGIALVPLKGAALHAAGIYRAGERPMADIDLLVAQADAKATGRLLADCGFECTFTTWRHEVFEHRARTCSKAFGEHVDNPIKIEVHTGIRDRLPVSEIDITAFVMPRRPRAGLNDYPSHASLMMHLLLHAAGNMRARALRLIQLQDIARLAARFCAGDWQELLAARPNGRAVWWGFPPLMLTARYHRDAIPSYVAERLKRECPRLLGRAASRHRLSDVSWSNIKAEALPGIEWSSSAKEALGFMIGRIWPNAEARWELKHFADYHPGASEVPWYGISQGARILRWVLTDPPRVQTLLPVQKAFAQATERRSGAPDTDAAPIDIL